MWDGAMFWWIVLSYLIFTALVVWVCVRLTKRKKQDHHTGSQEGEEG